MERTRFFWALLMKLFFIYSHVSAKEVFIMCLEKLREMLTENNLEKLSGIWKKVVYVLKKVCVPLWFSAYVKLLM